LLDWIINCTRSTVRTSKYIFCLLKLLQCTPISCGDVWVDNQELVSVSWETFTLAFLCGSPVLNFAARPHNDASADGRTSTIEETYNELRCAQNERQT